MKSSKIIIIHLVAFLGLSIIFFFLSEEIIKLIFPETHNVILWLYLLIFGISLMFILSTVSCLYLIKKRKNQLLKKDN